MEAREAAHGQRLDPRILDEPDEHDLHGFQLARIEPRPAQHQMRRRMRNGSLVEVRNQSGRHTPEHIRHEHDPGGNCRAPGPCLIRRRGFPHRRRLPPQGRRIGLQPALLRRKGDLAGQPVEHPPRLRVLQSEKRLPPQRVADGTQARRHEGFETFRSAFGNDPVA